MTFRIEPVGGTFKYLKIPTSPSQFTLKMEEPVYQRLPLGIIQFETTTPVPKQVIRLTDRYGNYEIVWVEWINHEGMGVHRGQAMSDWIDLAFIYNTELIGYAPDGVD